MKYKYKYSKNFIQRYFLKIHKIKIDVISLDSNIGFTTTKYVCVIYSTNKQNGGTQNRCSLLSHDELTFFREKELRIKKLKSII